MKFQLTRLDNGEQLNLCPNKDYSVGRKDCDIMIENDQSISRKHAILRVKNDFTTLEDCGSKYKTLHNNNEIDPHTEVKLCNNDEIKFGILNSSYRYNQVEFITTATGLNNLQKQELKLALSLCNGLFVDKWTKDCTHLTVQKITLTVKLLQALIDEKPLVTLEYWTDYAESIKKKLEPPDIKKYNKPPMGEALLNQYEFKPNPERRKLFDGRVFIFSTEKDKNQVEDIIRSCGGECISWEKDPLTLNNIKNSVKEFLIIQTDKVVENDSLSSVITHFRTEGKRTIPLQEIALAVLLCSCEKNCNPNFNRAVNVFAIQSQCVPTQNILAAATQETQPQSSLEEDVIIINETENDLTMPVPIKKPNGENISLESDCTASSKRPNADQGNQDGAKKMRVKSNSREVTQIPVKDFFIGKNKVAEKRKYEDDTLDKTDAKKLHRDNPFACIKPSTNSMVCDDNPFEKIKKANKRMQLALKKPELHRNPFASMRILNETVSSSPETSFQAPRSKASKIVSSTFKKQKNENLSQVQKSDLMFTGTLQVSRISSADLTWISKNGVKNEIVLKEENPDLEKFTELFKNCVTVEFLPDSYVRKLGPDIINTVNTTEGKKNFKKFRKVVPLNPQTTIMSRKDFFLVGAGDTTDIERCNFLSDDEERPVPCAAQNRGRKKKDFVL